MRTHSLSVVSQAALCALILAGCQCAAVDPLARYACTPEGTCVGDELCHQGTCWPASCADGGGCPPGWTCSPSSRCVAETAADAATPADAAAPLTDAAVEAPDAHVSAPDAGPGDASATAPDSAVLGDAATTPDAATLPDASAVPDATLAADAGGAPDASAPADAAAPADASAGPADAGAPSPDASATSCTIGGTLYGPGDPEPSNPCGVCDPARSATDWSAVPDGTGCDLGRQCLGRKCLGPYFVGAQATNLLTEVLIDLPAPTKAGNMLVVGIETWDYDTKPNVISVTDLKGDHLTRIASLSHSSVADSLEVWSISNVASSATQVRVTFDGLAKAQVSLHVDEYEGMGAATVGTVSVGSGNGAALAAGPITTTAPTELLYAFFGCTSECSPGAGFTQRTNPTNGVDLTEDRVVTPGTYTATASQASGYWLGAAVAFRPGASAGSGLAHLQGVAKVLDAEPRDRVDLPSAGLAGDTLVAAAVWAPPDASASAAAAQLVDRSGATWTLLVSTGLAQGRSLGLWSRHATDASEVSAELVLDQAARASLHLVRYSSLGAPGAPVFQSGTGATGTPGPLALGGPSLVFAFGASVTNFDQAALGWAGRTTVGGALCQDLAAAQAGPVTATFQAHGPSAWSAAAVAFPLLP